MVYEHQDYPGWLNALLVCTFRHTIFRQHLSCTLDRHWLLPKLPIEQNHGIDNLTTLHAAFRRKFQYETRWSVLRVARSLR